VVRASYDCFITALLLLYCCFTTAAVRAVHGTQDPREARLVTTALLLLYYCFTTSLLLLQVYALCVARRTLEKLA
jgi:hypothetical protein